jgi:hypothetical protein
MEPDPVGSTFPRTPLRWILIAGLVTGTLDLLFAIAYWAGHEVPAIAIMQSIAAGLLGTAAFKGGATAAALGVACHFTLTTAMAGACYFIGSHWPALLRRPLKFGIGYGLFLFAAMRYVVVPLSAAPPSGGGPPSWLWASIAAHVLLVGIPCVAFARLALRGRSSD